MGEITLTIDGQEVTVNEGMTVLQAAEQAGIYIPTLCYHPDLAPYGACRLCIVCSRCEGNSSRQYIRNHYPRGITGSVIGNNYRIIQVIPGIYRVRAVILIN